MPSDRREPLTGGHFRIEIDGLQSAAAVEVIFPEARLAAEGETRRTTFGPLVLRRGLTTADDWYRWWEAARASGRDVGRTVHVILMDRLNADLIRWTFVAAVPVTYSVSPLNARDSAAVIEAIELAVEGFRAFER